MYRALTPELKKKLQGNTVYVHIKPRDYDRTHFRDIVGGGYVDKVVYSGIGVYEILEASLLCPKFILE